MVDGIATDGAKDLVVAKAVDDVYCLSAGTDTDTTAGPGSDTWTCGGGGFVLTGGSENLTAPVDDVCWLNDWTDTGCWGNCLPPPPPFVFTIVADGMRNDDAAEEGGDANDEDFFVGELLVSAS
jgi:hypothetical protein